MISKKVISTSICLESWLNDLLTLRAKNSGESKSQIIRTLIKDSLVRSAPARSAPIGYYNDPEGVLRAIK